MRLRAYAGVSAGIAAGALIKAFNERPNFYCAAVYLSQSNACILILTNFALVCVASFMFGLQRLLYGSLRQLEIEQLSEKAWYAVLDTLLAMPSLRDDVGGWTLATFVSLLAGKVWSWIGEGRVDILEQQPPPNPRMFHARLATSLFISILFDLLMFRYCVKSVLENPGPGLIIIFTFEFAILSIFSISTACRYLLTLNEMRITRQQVKARVAERREEILQERLAEATQRQGDQTQSSIRADEAIQVDEDDIEVPGWEEKRQWLLVLDLVTDAIKIVIYIAFFGISINFVGFPMHVMRDVYLTIASFSKRLTDYQVYRRTTTDMNSRYPDATAQELANENTCIVCREVMTPWQTDASANSSPTQPAQATQEAQSTQAAPSRANAHRRAMTEWLRAKKLPCGHILHLRCLKAWLERQQACPTCRRPVLPTDSNTTTGSDASRNAGAGGGARQNGDGADANGARPARRANVRWINMGPVRIGFGDRLPRRQADAAAPAAVAGGGATGAPSALNLGQAHAGLLSNTSLRLSHRSELTTQEQLRAVELRLLRQANSLRLEQAQLTTVRLLELELERLRSLHNMQSTTGAFLTPGLARAGTPNPLDRIASSTLGTQSFVPQTSQFTHAFRGGASHTALGAGNENLPEGLTLPTGWTMLPLTRLSGQPPPAQTVSGFTAHGPPMQLRPLHPVQASLNNIIATEGRSTSAPPPETRSTSGVLNRAAMSNAPAAPAVATPHPAPASEAQPAVDPGWGFNDLEATPGNSSVSDQDRSGSGLSQAQNAEGSKSKGKGRAVEMEEVPDAEQ